MPMTENRSPGVGQHGEEAPAEEIGVSRPPRADVVAVLDDERRRIVALRTALHDRPRSADELARRIERRFDLVLDVLGIRPVVTPEPPEGEQVRGALHVLRQTGGSPPGEDALAGAR